MVSGAASADAISCVSPICERVEAEMGVENKRHQKVVPAAIISPPRAIDAMRRVIVWVRVMAEGGLTVGLPRAIDAMSRVIV